MEIRPSETSSAHVRGDADFWCLVPCLSSPTTPWWWFALWFCPLRLRHSSLLSSVPGEEPMTSFSPGFHLKWKNILNSHSSVHQWELWGDNAQYVGKNRKLHIIRHYRKQGWKYMEDIWSLMVERQRPELLSQQSMYKLKCALQIINIGIWGKDLYLYN